MITTVDLAGRRWRWRLFEGYAVAEWLASEPWHEGDSPLIVQAAPLCADDLVEEFRGEVRRRAGGYSEVQVSTLEAELCRDGPRQALWRWMGLPPRSPRELAEELARISQERPRLILALLPPEITVATWRDDLQKILDIQSKLPDSGAAAFVLLHTGRQLATGAQRLDLGWPVPSIGEPTRLERWSFYVHERVAWHAGGSLQVVGELASIIPELVVGDDRGLERTLDRHAKDALETIDPDTRQGLALSLDPIRHAPTLLLPPAVAGGWAQAERPAPWLARGLLLRHHDHPQRRFLRSLCICRPLADRLLGRCQNLEQHIRDRLMQTCPREPPPQQAMDKVKRLAADSHAIEHRITPSGQAPAEDPWDVASLHDLMQVSSVDGATRNAMHDLRRVRNALAHGSPVGWEAIEIVESLEDRLRR